VLLVIAVTGLTLFFAALQVFIRDVEHVLMPLLMILMYLTPILYPLTAVPDAIRPYVAANPFGYLVERLRAGLLDGRLGFDVGDGAAVLIAAGLFFGGRWVFRRLSPTFEDVL
jgi:lipopolysaccharide transport system permease protein